jgi:hypothetical protein
VVEEQGATQVSDEKKAEPGNVVALPVAPALNGSPMLTVRIPQALANVVAGLYPHVEFALGATLAAEDVIRARESVSAHHAAIAENQRLKIAFAELALRYREEVGLREERERRERASE